MKYDYRVSVEFLKAIICWRSLPVFDAGILMRNPSPIKLSTWICRSSKPSACSSISLPLDMAGNLQPAIGQTCNKRNARKTMHGHHILASIPELLSVQHVGLCRKPIVCCGHVVDIATLIFCLRPTFYPSQLAFGEWLDGSWWFLIVPDHTDISRVWKGRVWITWSIKGDSWSK